MNWNPDKHYQNQQVAQGYDKARFSTLAGRVFNRWEKHVIATSFSSVPKGGQIADMPCGTGRLAEALLANGYRVHGMDISGEMLDVAKQRLGPYAERFTCEIADAKRLATSTTVYDAALCARVLMHFPLDQQIEFLSGVAKLSRSVVVINHSLDSPYQRFRRRLKRWLGHQASAMHPIDNRSIDELLRRSGLREIRRRRLLPLISEALYIVAERA